MKTGLMIYYNLLKSWIIKFDYIMGYYNMNFVDILDETITLTLNTFPGGDKKLVINPGEGQVYFKTHRENSVETEVLLNACPIGFSAVLDEPNNRYLFCSRWYGEGLDGYLDFKRVDLNTMVVTLKNRTGLSFCGDDLQSVLNMVIQCFIRHNFMEPLEFNLIE